jgi:hypothetical protein
MEEVYRELMMGKFKPFMWLLVIVGLLVALFSATNGCTAPDRTKRTLLKAGFTDVDVGGHAWFDCGEDDVFATEFTATNVNGQRVSGAVCCGFIAKNCTIRF